MSLRVSATLFCSLLLPLALFISSCDKETKSPHLKWVFKASRDQPWSGYGGANKPISVGDYVVYIGGYTWQNQVYLYVINKKTGELVWKNTTSTYQFMVSKDKVVVTTRAAIHNKNPAKSRVSMIICYDLETGSKQWTREISVGRIEPRILPVENSVYIWIPGSKLFRLELDSGKLIWRIDGKKDSEAISKSTVTAYGDTVFIAQPQAGLVLVDGAQSKYTASISLKGLLPKSYFSDMQLIENKLFLFGSTGYVTVIDLDSKKVILNKPIGLVKQEVSLEKNKLFFGDITSYKRHDQDDLYTLKCYDMVKKEQVWQKQFIDKNFSKPVLGKKFVFIGNNKSEDGKKSKEQTENLKSLYALTKSEGKIGWQREIGPINGDPVFDKGTLYVSGKSFFYALNASTGETVWKVKPLEFVPADTPLVTSDSVYFVGKDSYLYCMNPISKTKAAK